MRKIHGDSGTALLERQAPEPKNRKENADVWLEYPQQDAVVAHPDYTMQIAAVPEAMRVEVSIDQGEWQPCRESLGLWWFDWTGYGPGEHEATARIHKDGGTIVRSEPRRFFVRLP